MDITDRPSALMELAIRKEDTGQRVKLQCKSSSSYMFLYLYINMLGGNYDGAYCIDPYDWLNVCDYNYAFTLIWFSMATKPYTILSFYSAKQTVLL